jgi:hypothetical protein
MESVSYPRWGRISNCFYEWTGNGLLPGLGEAGGRFQKTHFLEVWDGFREGHEIHTFGAVEFQEAGRFICGRTGRQDIVQEKKRSAQDLRVVLQSEGAIDIDRTFALTQGSLAWDRTVFDQKRSFDGRCKPRLEYRCEDLRLIKMSFHEFHAIDRYRQDGIVPEIRGDGLRKSDGTFLAGLEKIVFACVLDPVQQLSDR